MVLTLLAVAALIFLTGAENTFLIAIAALLAYLYPAWTILGLACIALLKWQGEVFKQKLINYFRNRRKNK